MFFSLCCLLALRSGSCQQASKEIHAFYYLWYGNPATDGQFRHWNHEVLPHWTAAVNRNHPTVGLYFDPSNDNLHSPYYPEIGPYSSRDPATIRRHFEDLKRAGIGVLAVSWWGQGHKAESTDNQGVSTDDTVALLLKIADESNSGISICFHIEPYPGRSAQSTLEDIEYIHQRYGHHKSLARRKGGDNRVIFYIYDSYHVPYADWAEVFSPTGSKSIRDGGANSHLNSFVIGLWLESHHGHELAEANFDGFYTYFASDGFSYGSSSNNWKKMCSFAKEKGMTCTLSVGPGYQDDKIRPWNGHNTKPRRDGAYYDHMWRKAIEAGAEIVSITSFNEWGEGTQIEPVRSDPPPPRASSAGAALLEVADNAEYKPNKSPDPVPYLTYGSMGSYGYIDKTAVWAKAFEERIS